MNPTKHPCGLVRILLLSFLLLIGSFPTLADINPNHVYLYKGKPVGERSFSLGDPTNWSLSVQDRTGESAGGKVSLAPADFREQGDAIQITWSGRKKVNGSIGLYGSPVDLSQLRDKVALTLDMRIDQKPNADVKVGLDCGYPCRAELTIRRLLKTMPTGEWFSLPLPLNCFKSKEFDLSKINGPFTMSTEGKLKVSITNIRLAPLEEGETGCVEKQD